MHEGCLWATSYYEGKPDASEAAMNAMIAMDEYIGGLTWWMLDYCEAVAIMIRNGVR